MPVPHFYLFAGCNIPGADGLVRPAGGQGLAVRREGDRQHFLGVAGKRTDRLELGGIPKLHEFVGPGRGDVLAVRR